MRVAVSHNTTRDNARRIVEQKLGQMLSQFGSRADVEHAWEGDMLRFKGKASGFSVEGTLEVTDQVVIIDGKLPLMAKPFEGRIRSTIEREAESMFRTA